MTTAADRTKTGTCCGILHREQWPANTGTSTVKFLPAGLPSGHQIGALASWKERSIGQRRTAWLTPSVLWRPAPTQTSVGPSWLEMKMGRCTFPTSTGITTLAQACGQASERNQITSALWIFISSTSSFHLGTLELFTTRRNLRTSFSPSTWNFLVLELRFAIAWRHPLGEYSILLLLSPLLIFRMSAKSTLETAYCAGLVSVIRSVSSEELGCKQFLWLDTCLFVTARLINDSYSVADHVMQWMLFLWLCMLFDWY